MAHWMGARGFHRKTSFVARCIHSQHKQTKNKSIKMSESFSYEPLLPGQIRLLKILGPYSDAASGITSIEASHVDLSSAPGYVALSYCWGDGKTRDIVRVNDSNLPVTQSVGTLLPYLPRALQNHGCQHFWIDGICVNQLDEDEKATQVRMMESIYSKSIGGLIWLGDCDEIIAQALPLFPSVAAKFASYDHRLGFDEPSMITHGLPPPSSPFWAAVDRIFSKEWFMRVWTFQEAVLPPKITFMCGTFSIDLPTLDTMARQMFLVSQMSSMEHLTNAIEADRRKANDGFVRVRAVQGIRERRQRRPDVASSLLDVLQDAWPWGATKEHDKIYGMLGLAEPSLRKQIVIDYSMAISRVYAEFSKLCIVNDPNLELLHLTPSWSRGQMKILPSWCPNFSSEPPATPFGPSSADVGFRAGLALDKPTVQPSVKEPSFTLHIQGFEVDEITDYIACPWERMSHKTPEDKGKGVAELIRWDAQCLRLSRRVAGIPPSDSGEVPDCHWRTLIADHHLNHTRYRLPAEIGRETYHLARLAMLGMTSARGFSMSAAEMQLAAQQPTIAQMVRVSEYSTAFGFASHGRGFFATRGGRVGLASWLARVGDKVCILYGGRTPYIIRRELGNEIFVGECYVDGLMDGEALTLEGMTDEVFALD